MKIFLIEDDSTDMKLFTAVLQSGGHIVVEKTSPENVVKEIKAAKPDVIVLDLKLPGMNGLAIARLLKCDSHTRHIPIVAITGATGIFSKEEAMASGCDAFISKPVDTRSLSAQVTSAVSHTKRLPSGEDAP